MTRLLLDENVSPGLAEVLSQHGHDAVHVNEAGLGNTPDAVIMLWAARHGRTVVTHDHDFVEGLWNLRAGAPSVIKLAQRGRDALAGTAAHAAHLRVALPKLERRLEAGAIVVMDRSGYAATPLPLAHRVARTVVPADLSRGR